MSENAVMFHSYDDITYFGSLFNISIGFDNLF